MKTVWETRGTEVPNKAISTRDVPLHSPYVGLVSGSYLQFGPLKWLLIYGQGFFSNASLGLLPGLSENMLPHSVACSDPHVVFKIAIHVGIRVCLKIVYPYTQWLMIIIPTKWLFHWEYAQHFQTYPYLMWETGIAAPSGSGWMAYVHLQNQED